jgi:putative DNA primase/helicase
MSDLNPLDVATTYARLAGLSARDYDLARPEAASSLGVRTSTLDAEVAKIRMVTRPLSNRDTDLELTEDGIALAFTAHHHELLRYCHDAGSWFHWTGAIWRRERTKLAFSWARQVARQMIREDGADADDRAKFSRAAVAAAVERFAQSDRAFAVTSETWDADPWLLGTPAGTVELKTGKIRPAAQTDFITKMTAVAPADQAHCPLWLKFLDDACNHDADLIRFLRQWCGYMLTGDIREHALLFIYGPGGNGKSVFLNVIAAILSDYACTAAMDTFTSSAGDKHPTDMARLHGARMVCASETEEGKAWAEVRIKQLTGGDVVAARYMRMDFFEFKPQFKLTIVGNHKPVLQNVDDAARRRFNVLPFVHKPENPDRQLEEKLRKEWPGILRWMIDGCQDWRANGLVRPQIVMDTTNAYFSEQDIVHHWIEDCCETGVHKADSTAKLFKSWSEYALANGEKPGSTKSFTQVLVRHGCSPTKRVQGERNGRGWTGIEVKLPPATKSHHEPPDYDEQRF